LISIPTPSILLISITSQTIIQYADAVPTSSTDRKRRRRQEEREKRRQQREEQRRQFKEQYFGDDYNTYTNNNEEGGTTSSFDMSSLPSLFNTQKPRDILEGFKMSLSNTLRGTFYGLTAFIATPIGGLKYGIIGLIGGIVTGSILGIVMPLYGVIVGITQFARGIIETPQAIVDGFVNCKVYDDTKRTWLEYRLDDDIDEINRLMMDEQTKSSSSGSSESTSSSSRRRVKSTEYYDLLDIQPDASPSEIRSAYRKKARIIHPDKNPDDPNAEENFRILSAAYQTLSDPNKRHKYDTSGRGVDPESPDGMNGDGSIMLDPIVFFAILFGSEQVEPYIGELSMATTFDALLKLGNSGGRTSSSFESWEDIKTAFGWNEAALKRRKRETEIAIHLRSRISDYVDGYLTLDAFKDGCWEEAIQIAKGGGGSSSSYSASFLLAIGPALIVEADAFLGYRSSVLGSWRGPISIVKRNMLFIRRKFAVGRSVLRTISHSLRALYESAEVTPDNESRGSIHHQRRSSSRHDRSGSDKNKRRSDNDRVEFDQELLKDNLSNTIPTILDMAWAINYVDISNTLYGACGKLFYDADVSSWEERLRRAEAVHILGSQFYIVGLEASGGNRTVMTTSDVDDIKAQANAAFMESLKKKSSSNKDEM